MLSLLHLYKLILKSLDINNNMSGQLGTCHWMAPEVIKNNNYSGTLKMVNDLKISYVEQSTENLKGNVNEYIKTNNLDEPLFKAMLIKMGFKKDDFNKNLQSLSEGQKKKILLAKSFSENANIYIWDEPLNYIDIITRTQIEESILKYKPTLIFVEHDETFVKNIANKIVLLTK